MATICTECSGNGVGQRRLGHYEACDCDDGVRASDTVVELVGGPFDGVMHELRGMMPAAILLPKDGKRCQYNIDSAGIGYFTTAQTDADSDE